MKKRSTTPDTAYTSAMQEGGLRLTPQRRHVYEVLMEKRDHPTATEVFLRVQKRIASISLATVYNCLETMVGNGLVKAVHVDREPTRFCANLREHGHFHCAGCGGITDIDFSGSPSTEETGKHASESPGYASGGWHLPEGYLIAQQDVTLRGLCGKCTSSKSGKFLKTVSNHSKSTQHA